MNKEQAGIYRKELSDLVKSTTDRIERKEFLESIRADSDYQKARGISIEQNKVFLEQRKPEQRKQKSIEYEFPQDPEERFNALFPAIGNSEAKCLTLLCLSESPVSGHSLYKEFLEKSKTVWRSNKSVQSGYYNNTLIPIGMVAEADIIPEGSLEHVSGYRLTDAGYEIGQPVAAYLITKSSELPDSLISYFGGTNTIGNTRSPVNRAIILEYLASRQQDDNLIDIANGLGIPPNIIGRHLSNLSELGLVDYSTADSEEKGVFKYRLTGGVKREDVRTVKKLASLTKAVADV